MIVSVKNILRGVKEKLLDLQDARGVRQFFRYEWKFINSPEISAIWEKVKLTPKQEREIDEFWTEHYGEKIPHMWHRFYTAFTGNFDVRYIPDPIYLTGAERRMNSKHDYVSVLQDKNLIPLIARSAGIKTPEVIVSCTNGVLRDGANNIITESEADSLLKDAGEGFYKASLDSCGGASCRCVNYGMGGGAYSFRAA